MYVDFENLDGGEGNADEFFDNHLEDNPSNQASEERAQPEATPPGPASSAGNGPKRGCPPAKSTGSSSYGSSSSTRKSPLKAWNRQARTPDIDHLRPNPSSASSLETINKSGNGKKHLTKDQAAQMVQRLVPSQGSLASKSKFVSMAEETKKYYGTPDRFRRAKFRSSSVGAHPRRRSPSPAGSLAGLTNPVTPKLATRGRARLYHQDEEKPKEPSAEDRLASLRKRMNVPPPAIKQTASSKLREEKAKNAGNVAIKQPLKALHNGVPIILGNKLQSKAALGSEVKKPLPPIPADSVHIKLYERNKEIRAKLENNREKEIERERQMAQGVKAREATVLSKKPFLPIGSDREPVRPIDSHLRTELRSEERRQYEQRLKEKEAEMEASRQQEFERQEQARMLELTRQRDATITRAQPIRHFKPIEIAPSNQPLTVPQTPKFSEKHAKRIRHKSSS